MQEKKKNKIVTVYSTGDGNPYPMVDEREKPRFIEKESFETGFNKKSVRAAEREYIHRVRNPDGSVEERVYKERFEKKKGTK